MPYRDSLLEHGFTYLVLQTFAQLTTGTKVRLLEANYHQAPRSENIGEYLQKSDPFDWSEGMSEYGAAFRAGREVYHQEVHEETQNQNKAAAVAVAAFVKQGLSPREAYQRYLKSRS